MRYIVRLILVSALLICAVESKAQTALPAGCKDTGSAINCGYTTTSTSSSEASAPAKDCADKHLSKTDRKHCVYLGEATAQLSAELPAGSTGMVGSDIASRSGATNVGSTTVSATNAKPQPRMCLVGSVFRYSVPCDRLAPPAPVFYNLLLITKAGSAATMVFTDKNTCEDIADGTVIQYRHAREHGETIDAGMIVSATCFASKF